MNDLYQQSLAMRESPAPYVALALATSVHCKQTSTSAFWPPTAQGRQDPISPKAGSNNLNNSQQDVFIKREVSCGCLS